jgi:phospholipase/carboxylesterase
MRAVTITRGAVMRAWYDVRGVDGERREDADGVRASQAQIEALIAREKTRGIAAGRIVLAGFSQGGAMALHTGLRHPEPLAGIMALSCFLPLADALAQEASPANRDVPLFMAHGRHDDLIPLARARRAHDILADLGYRVEWHDYPMPHSVCPEEIADISAWLSPVLGK